MKKLYILLLLGTVLCNPAWSRESEPNNSPATADTLALNFTDSGRVNPALDEDWWQVTTTAEGKLSVTLTSITKIYIWVEIYDLDGTTLLAKKNGNSTFTVYFDGAAVGQYYVRVYAFYTTQIGNYAIKAQQTLPAQANDTEPNNKRGLALRLPLNGSAEGHVGYYYDHYRDTADWYKVTLNADGKLRVKLVPANGLYVWVHVYDYSGTVILGQENSKTEVNLLIDGLAAGTFFIRVTSFYTNEFAPYTISDSLLMPAELNDKENNDVPSRAVSITANGSATGHIGYFNSFKRDSIDWYRLESPVDGKIRARLNPVSGQYVWIRLYDADGVTLLAEKSGNSEFAMEEDGLAKGTYYLQVQAFYASGFSSYILKDSVLLPSTGNDAENNDTPTAGDTLALGGSRSGLIGYYHDHKRDTADWYVITTNADGKLQLKLTPVSGQYLWVAVYDKDGKTLINKCNNNQAFTCETDGLAKGTFYVKIYAFYTYGFSPYILSDSLIEPLQSNDPELNDTRATAVALTIKDKVEGHIGYLNNNRRDTLDWYKVTIGKDGKLAVTCTPVYGNYVWLRLYDNNATTLLAAKNAKSAFGIIRNDLAAGTYYIQVSAFYQNEFTPYVLADTFTKDIILNDIEPNNNVATARTIRLDSALTGHVGYYYKLVRDTADFYRISTRQSGQLRLGLTPVNGQAISIQLLDSAGTRVLASGSNTVSFTLVKTALLPGSYCIRIFCQSSSSYTAYKFTDTLIRTSLTENAPQDLAETGPVMEKTLNGELLSGHFKAYPNPASNWITLIAGANVSSLTGVRLVDLNGKLLRWLNPVGKTGIYKLYVGDIIAGQYTLQLFNAHQPLGSIRILIIR